MSPTASVERCSGSELTPPSLDGVVDLVERNMKPHYGATWNRAEKAEELGDPKTRFLILRSSEGDALLGFAAYQIVVEETVKVAYIYELQLEAATRGFGLGSELVREVEKEGRAAGALGLMLTVHTSNTLARRFYEGALRFEVSPISPSACAPPALAARTGYEVMQLIWDEESRRRLVKRGEKAKQSLHAEAIEEGSFKVRVGMFGGDDRRAARSGGGTSSSAAASGESGSGGGEQPAKPEPKGGASRATKGGDKDGKANDHAVGDGK